VYLHFWNLHFVRIILPAKVVPRPGAAARGGDRRGRVVGGCEAVGAGRALLVERLGDHLALAHVVVVESLRKRGASPNQPSDTHRHALTHKGGVHINLAEKKQLAPSSWRVCFRD
jgi:hypothetical protein